MTPPDKRRQRKLRLRLSNQRDERLFAHLQSLGIELSEKARQAIELAIEDARTHHYNHIYDDSLLAGLIRSQGPAAHLLSSNGVDVSRFVQELREPLPDSAIRNRYSHKRADYRSNSRGRSVYRSEDLLYIGEGYDVAPLINTHAGRQVESTDLLLRVVEMPVVWHHLQRAGFSVNKIRRHIASLNVLEPDIEQQKFAVFHDGNQFRVSPFEFIDIAGTPSYERASSGLLVFRQQLLFPGLLRLEEEIEQFEWMLNRHDPSEYDLQRFFEEHPDFLLGIEHKKLHSQLVLTSPDGSELRPDFFLERVAGTLSDILDLKLPQARLVVGKEPRRTLSAALSSALGQLRVYRSFFDDVANRQLFHRRYGLEAYKPKVFVVIGRSNQFKNSVEREDLEQELSHLRILTYDDLLLRARRRKELLASYGC